MANSKAADETMKQDLTTLLCAVPFTPFTVKTRDGKMHPIDAVGRLCVADEICVYVDSQGRRMWIGCCQVLI